MASGKFGNYTHYLAMVEALVDAPNNRSLVDYTAWIHRDTSAANGAWGSKTGTGSFSGDASGGTSFSAPTTFDFRNYADLTIATGSFWVTHQADGTGSASGSFTWPYHTAGMPGGTVYEGITLTPITRFSHDYYTGAAWDGDFLDVFVDGVWKQQIVEAWDGSAWVRQQ